MLSSSRDCSRGLSSHLRPFRWDWILPGLVLSVILAAGPVSAQRALAVPASVCTDIRWLGARESADDNSVAIQTALDLGRCVVVPPTTTGYRFATPLRNPEMVPVVSYGTLVFTGEGADAFVWGDPDELEGHVYLSAEPSSLRITRETRRWDDDVAGVTVANVYGLQLHVAVSDFDVGLRLLGADYGCPYNTFFPNRLKDNRVAIQFRVEGDGYVNQNTFFGGRVSTNTSISSTTHIHAIEAVLNGSSSVNGNAFYNLSVELSNRGDGYTSVVHGRGSAAGSLFLFNQFFGFRFEATDYLLSGRGISNNEFHFTWGNPTLRGATPLLRGDTPGDELELAKNRFLGNRSLPLGRDEPLSIARVTPSQLVVESDSGQLMAPARGFWYHGPSGGVHLHRSGWVNGEAIGLGSSTDLLAQAFDLTDELESRRRQISVHVQSLPEQGGRVAAAAFDAEGTPLSAQEHCSLAYHSSSGFYRQGRELDLREAVTVVFGPDVARAYVGVVRGAQAAAVTQVEYFILGGSAIRRVLDVPGAAGLDTSDPVCDVAPAVPSAGAYPPAGTGVRNLAPAVGRPGGWTFDGARWLPQPDL